MGNLLRVCLWAGLIFLTAFNAGPADAGSQGGSDPFPKVASSYLVKVNGKTLWAHKPEKRLPPASLTKVMTALIALERADMDAILTVSRTAASETGSRIRLREGDRVRVGELVAASLIGSANDACRALAEHIGGTQEGFVRLMNRRAKELGLRNTRFANACGHDGNGHYSTAGDLALLSEKALENRIFRGLIRIVGDSITTVDGRRTFLLDNKNALIGRYPGAVGVKSGYTLKAGKCLIALAERDGASVLLVLLDAPDRWWSAVVILDEAFKRSE